MSKLSAPSPRMLEDTAAWARQLPETAIAELGCSDAGVAEGGGARLYVLHDVHALDLNPAAAGFNAVISGHSHKFGHSERAGVWYINPGSAGPRRFQLPVTVARLDVSVTPWKVEFVDLGKVE